VTLPWLAGRLGIAKLALLLVGGILYTAGAVVLGRQRPDAATAWYASTGIGTLNALGVTARLGRSPHPGAAGCGM
jgi:hypothetical protein